MQRLMQRTAGGSSGHRNGSSNDISRRGSTSSQGSRINGRQFYAFLCLSITRLKRRTSAVYAASAVCAFVALLMLWQLLSSPVASDNGNKLLPRVAHRRVSAPVPGAAHALDAGHWHYCNMSSIGSASAATEAACAYQHQHVWSQDKPSAVFVPHTLINTPARSPLCPARISRLSSLRCLQHQRLLFIGDSTMQELVVDLVSHLEGLSSEFILPPWITYTCPGGKNNLMYRVFTTAAYPSPALTAYNITLAFLFNGHAAICENTGDIQQQLAQHLWESVYELQAQCPDTFKHYRALGLLEQQLAQFYRATDEETTATAATALKARYDELLAMTPQQRSAAISASPKGSIDSVESSATERGIHVDYKLNATCDSEQPWSSVLAAVVADGLYPQFPLRSQWSESQVMHYDASRPKVDPLQPAAAAAAVSPVDVVVYNTGQHVLAVYPYNHELTMQFTATVAAVFDLLLSTVARHGVWKDSTPIQQYPALVPLNAVARALAVERGVLLWPVQQVLSFVDKEDARHCSYKSTAESFDARSVDVRSPFCHEAVQMLMRSLCSSQECQ